MDLTQFRTDFPEFTDTVKYTDAVLTFWSGFVETRLNVDRWAGALNYGVELATAHYVTLAVKDQINAAAGKVPGSSMQGAASSKSVGDVSVSYDTTSSLEAEAGHWNLTSYGRQFIRLARNIGMGGVQL